MAERRSGGRRAGRNRRAGAAPKPDFHRQMVLFQWALAKLGARDLKDFRAKFEITPDSPDGVSEQTGRHRFYEMMSIRIPLTRIAGGEAENVLITPGRSSEYEQNILAHTQALNTARARHGQPTISWKYHQYLALLFTEMFLDGYFGDPEGLRDEINRQIERCNEEARQEHLQRGVTPEAAERTDRVEPFSLDGPARQQLARLAFWCATGSGKTLLMHMHVRQFRQYHRRAFQAATWPDLAQVILITPNEGLSAQHRMEFEQSGFAVVSAAEQGVDGLFSAQYQSAIKILDIHKLRDEQGQNTVATEFFEGANLILVDEGHRGAGRGEEGKWMSRRDDLSRGGFCFEYSATFKEAVADDDAMRMRYARSILFDYAYRSFYRDGYGKDFSILNLEDDDKQKKYLTAALLLFYQQVRVWRDGGAAMKPFLIDKPLWVFVGHTVTSARATSVDDRESVSDVVEVLRFLKEFLADRDESIRMIQSLLEEGFVDQNDRNLLSGRLQHIDVSGDKSNLARDIHAGILNDVFNAPGGGALTVQLLKGAVGELAVLVGEGDPFGVVNVGDPDTVAEKCDAIGIPRREDDVNRPSLFRAISRDDSPINVLIGSRKFTEGWNSWRVSSIGLMRMGRNEGTQIIQLFGRGVRLRGYGMGLRRSSVLAQKPPMPRDLRLVETLQVFGVKASYMEKFREWILSEVPEALDKQVWDIPVVENLPRGRFLKTLRLKEEIDGVQVDRGRAFQQLGPLVMLRPPHPTAPEDAWLRAHRTRLNWLPRVRGIVGQDRQIGLAMGAEVSGTLRYLSDIPIVFFDVDELVFGLEAFKASRGLHRLHVDRAAVRSLLARHDWYELRASDDDMRLDRYENRTQWQRMAQNLLNAYAERFYRFIRGRWEAPYLEVAAVMADDPSMLTSYQVETTEAVQSAAEIDQIAGFVNDLNAAVRADKFVNWSHWQEGWRTVPFTGHLFQPLLYVGKNIQIRVSPVSLNSSEAMFVDDLATWCRSNRENEVFLLRNRAVTGLGFFQAANFFPDFLLWVVEGERQHLAFVDPKGLHHFDPSDPKVQFPRHDIPRLQSIIDRQSTGLLLHAFILSTTAFADLGWSAGGRNLMSKAEIEALGVLFQADNRATYVGMMMAAIRAVCASET